VSTVQQGKKSGFEKGVARVGENIDCQIYHGEVRRNVKQPYRYNAEEQPEYARINRQLKFT